jgi:hypothetical protein
MNELDRLLFGGLFAYLFCTLLAFFVYLTACASPFLVPFPFLPHPTSLRDE